MTSVIFPPVFVINLKRSTERKRQMTERLDPLNIPYSFFEATDGSTLEVAGLPVYARRLRRLFFGRDLTPGEIGCLLSHKALYQHMVDRHIERAIVLEDDVFLKPEFPDVIRAVLQTPLRWDVIRFLAQKKVSQTKFRPLLPLSLPPYRIARIGTTPGGAYGYMLTKKAAETFLRHMRKNILPVDILHGYVWKTGLETFVLNPSPVSPDMEGKSTIGYGQRFDKTLQLSGWERALYPITRSWLKFSELVGKNTAYGASWLRDREFQRKR